ncbi:MAG TPA: hypothetical protein VNY05_40185 [Candidatus Acidoferrales bacterium]|jgi:hypothetical protein|nr:hypothetical protein [Candidatus Acidoferrales bacterium]
MWYTREDIALLAGMDEVHETLSGPATKKLLQQACSPCARNAVRNQPGILFGFTPECCSPCPGIRSRVVVTGTPEAVAACKTSHTGRFLKAHMRG